MPKRPRSPPTLFPSYSISTPPNLTDFFRSYNDVHLAVFRGATNEETTKGSPLDAVRKLWTTCSSVSGTNDKESWTVETADDQRDDVEFLSSTSTVTGYCSFIVQHSSSAISIAEDTITTTTLPLSPEKSNDSLTLCKPIWVFVGRNASKGAADMAGRPLHTDSVSHDGTFHYQLSGRKIWTLRPTEELALLVKELETKPELEIVINAGDVICVNTRLWWHGTRLPSTIDAQDGVSISIARDVYFNRDASDDEGGEGLTNVDGMYAPKNITDGEIIFREDEMPDVELHRVADGNHNCEIAEVELGDEVVLAVVAARDIKSGEFFSLEESENESCDFDESDEEN